MPEEITIAQYLYRGDYYILGDYYAKYLSKGTWRESGSVTNDKLKELGQKI